LGERGQVQGTTATLFAIDVQPDQGTAGPDKPQLPNPTSIVWNQQLELLGYDHPSSAVIGETAIVGLAWRAQSAPSTNYAVRIGLTAESGITVHEQDYPISTYPSSGWRAGELIHELYDLKLPASLEGGSYQFTVEVRDGSGLPLASPEPLGTILVSLQERVFELSRPPQYPLDLRLGETISLLGYDLPRRVARAGEKVAVTLYWRCEGVVSVSYTVFVHLLGADGQIQGQQDRIPLDGQAPTTGWVKGQIIVDEYAIPISDQAQPEGHRLEVGMYDPRDVVRLPIFSQEGRLPDGRVLLEPPIVVTRK
jgi:hypothetical protein